MIKCQILQEIASMVGTNECTLKKAFKYEFGTTVFQFLFDYRMRLAAHFQFKKTKKRLYVDTFIFLYLLIYSSIIIIRKNDDKMKKKLLLLKSFCAYWGLNGRCIFKTNKT